MTDAPAEFCPYAGLAPFEKAHEDYFFGRDLDAEVIADNLLARRVTVLHGVSGCGKSSVLNVGLPRALQRIAKARVAVSQRQWHDPSAYTANLGADLLGSTSPPDDLAIALALYREKHGGPLVIVLDQLEEFFLYGEPQPEAAAAFVAGLAKAIAPPELDAHLLISLRADALHRLDALRLQLAELLDTTVELGHLDDAAVGEAVTGPIRVYNERFRLGRAPIGIDGGLVGTLLRELRRAGMRDDEEAAPDGPPAPIPLPFLQLTLRKLWDGEGGAEAKALTVVGLMNRLSGVRRIAQAHVEEVLGRLASDEERRICATVFDRLVTDIGTKVAYPATALAKRARAREETVDLILNRLATGPDRILQSLPTPGRPDETSFEIFHDVLAEPILRWKEGFEAAEAQRQAATEAAEQVRRDTEKREALAAERDRASRERLRLVRIAAVIVGILFIASAGLAGWAWHLSNVAGAKAVEAAENLVRATTAEARADTALGEARKNSETAKQALAEARRIEVRLGAQLSAKERDAGRAVSAMLIALRSLPKSESDQATPYFPGAEAELSAAWQASHERAYLAGHTGDVVSVAWSPDGQRLASASDDKTVRVWDPAESVALAVLEGHTGAVRSVAWRPDGQRLASASNDHTVRVWDPANPGALAVLEGHTDAVASVAWRPDGQRLASASADNTVRVWDPAEPVALAVLAGHTKLVESVAWSPDGQRLASASYDNTVRVWDPAEPVPLAVLEGHTEGVLSVAWRPDGQRLASASWDNTVRVWDPAEPVALAVLEGHDHTVLSVAWSPDGQRLASASNDGTVRVWRVFQDLWELRAAAAAALPVGHEVFLADERKRFFLDEE